MGAQDGTGNLPALGQLDLRRIFLGVNGRVIRGDELTLAVVELDSGAIVPEHLHDNEQLGLVLEGSVTFTVGDETKELGPGGIWRIPGGTPHSLVTGRDGAVVIDIFAPPRFDWDELEATPERALRWPSS
jgi:quercetin dioxygenase-like cupin family protein